MALKLGADPALSAIILVSAKSVVLAANALGQAELRGGVTLGPDRRVSFPTADVQDRFEQAMRVDGARAPEVLLSSGTQDIRLRLMPAELRHLLERGTAAHTVIIMSPRKSARAADLRSAFGLTVAEFDIALSLARGVTSAEIAVARGVTINTLRNQLKSVMSKAGVRRQSDLVITIDRFLRK